MMDCLKKVKNIMVEIYVKLEEMGIAVSSLVNIHNKSCAILYSKSCAKKYKGL